MGLWEKINNPNFKGVEFDSFKNQAGANSFTLSPSKWIEATNAIGLRSTAGFVYASEADVLNVALFGMTAKEWRELNPPRLNKAT